MPKTQRQIYLLKISFLILIVYVRHYSQIGLERVRDIGSGLWVINEEPGSGFAITEIFGQTITLRQCSGKFDQPQTSF